MPPGGCENCPQRNSNNVNVVTGRPYCDDCYVKLMPENDLIASIYLICRDQFIMGASGPITIDNLAIHKVIEMFDVPKQQGKEMFIKLKEMTNNDITKINQRTKR